MKLLYLTLKKKWFDRIKEGHKKVEYREIKPYWTSRLCNPDGTFKKFDYIIFKNGYSKTSPMMIVRHLGTDIDFCYLNNETSYAIELGKVYVEENE